MSTYLDLITLMECYSFLHSQQLFSSFSNLAVIGHLLVIKEVLWGYWLAELKMILHFTPEFLPKVPEGGSQQSYAVSC